MSLHGLLQGELYLLHIIYQPTSRQVLREHRGHREVTAATATQRLIKVIKVETRTTVGYTWKWLVTEPAALFRASYT
jgi:hypothetical protein